MQLSFGPWGASLAEMSAAARAAEDAGFTHAWCAELHRSAFVPAAAMADATTSIGIGTAIALAFVRSPMTTALSALDLDELSGGRFTLGLGSGVARLNEDWHGANFGKPVPHMRESVAVILEVIARAHLGETIEMSGEYESIRLRHYQRPFPPVRTRIPIYIAAVGDLMTRLTGEIADGWLGHELNSPRYMSERLLPNLLAGLERAGRARTDLDIVASVCCVIDADGKQARRWAAGLVAFYASVRTYQPFFAFHGFEAEAVAIQNAFRAGDEQAMVDACPDEMVDALTFAGTPDEVRARLTAYEGIADRMKLTPPTHLVPEEVTRQTQAAILEHLAPVNA
jgi:probable F420-dependent oxidoreductase